MLRVVKFEPYRIMPTIFSYLTWQTILGIAAVRLDALLEVTAK
jgi:hypothetical protein